MQNYYQEDEINLKELFNTLWLKKNLIISITASFTILAGIYAFSKTPIYKATALVEIGNYKSQANANANDITILDSAENLSLKLNIIFIDIFKHEEDREFEITSISIPKKVKNFIEIKSEAFSNEIASREILKVFSYIEKTHQNRLDNILSDIRSRIKSINDQINTIKNKQLELLHDGNDNLNGNKALLRSLQLKDMINVELGIGSISKLINEKTELTLLLNDQNYSNSVIVGQIITNEKPVKPKKELIVIVAFIVGFILSIFSVFIMNTFRKEEDKVTA